MNTSHTNTWMLPTSIVRTYSIPSGSVYVMYLNTPKVKHESLRRRKGKGRSYLHQQLQAPNFSDIGVTVGAERLPRNIIYSP